jgi:hypothetical protein
MMTLFYSPTTARARAAPPRTNPAFPVTCDIPAELVLLAAEADDMLEPVGVEVCVDFAPVKVVTEAACV